MGVSIRKISKIDLLADMEISESDAISGMQNTIRYKQRLSGEWIAIGIAGRSRILELVYIYDRNTDYFFVFHAMTPPSKETYRELDLER